MIKTTIAQLEEKVKQLDSIKTENKDQLLKLLVSLKTEIEELSKTKREEAESILGFTTVSTHETMRQAKNPHLVKLSLEGLASSVKGFESSHPTLVGTCPTKSPAWSSAGISGPTATWCKPPRPGTCRCFRPRSSP